MPISSLVGQIFTRLTVVARVPKPAHRCGDGTYWLCRCVCGRERIVKRMDLTKGHTTSCGCLKIERIAALNRTHGQAHRIPEYAIWSHMIQRCENPRDKRYRDWGGRGITVCQEWRESFEAFLRDMGPRPSPQHQIERLNNDEPYCKNNCAWTTRIVQANNKRNNRQFTMNGRTQTLMQWTREYHVSYHLVYHRLKSGWSIERALTEPAHWNPRWHPPHQV